MKQISLLSILLSITLLVIAQNGKELTFQKWALTPPMGWNSWDCYGPSVVESEVKANVDYMAANLKQYGWEYIVVDIRWYVDNQTTGAYNAFANSTFVYDQFGRYMPSPTRFPSAANGAGFKPLADYIHSKGLKFGIHIMRGVPRVAVNNNLPIKNGNGKTAADIYSTANQCTWLQDNYTVIASKAGAQEYYNSMLELYASWGVDFIKCDDLSRPYHADEIQLLRNAIDKCGRAIVLSMSPGETPVENYEHARTHANMWRTVDDFWDNWSQLNYQFTVCNKWAPYIAPGTWPDADMLPMGKFIRGERATNRYTNFTADEQYSLMTLWSIFKSPLMFGGNLPDNQVFTNTLITNNEVLQVNKTSVNNKQWFNANDQIAWVADDPNNGDKFMALFNNGGDGFISTKNLLYRSGTVSRLTDNYGVAIDVAISEESTSLYLIVNDGGDGYSCDHADWINPTLYKANGDSLKLMDINWLSASTGWGTIVKNKSISGGTLNIKGKTYANGIGVHARSVIFYPIPAGYNRFKAFGGLDLGGTSQTGGATVEFSVATQDPTLRNVDVNKAIANTGLISRTFQRAGKNITADITGASKLYLVVTDAADNFNYDHADWINPTIYKANGDSLKLTSLTPVSATSGWDVVRTNKSLNNGTLTVNGKAYTNGFGVNSYSTIQFNLPEGYTTFKAFCGFDDEVLTAANGVTVEFMVFTQDPANSSVAVVPVNLTALGFKGDCLIRDLWAKKDSGIFSGTQFTPSIKTHGAKMYRISAQNRSNQTSVNLTASTTLSNYNDTVLLNISVQKTGNATELPTGSVLILRNDTVVGVVPVDNSGNAAYTICDVAVGIHLFTAKYSGNTAYSPQLSNSISVEVKKKETAVSIVDYTNGVGVFTQNGTQFLKGLKPGDEVAVFDTSGKLLSIQKASADKFMLTSNRIGLIKVKSNGKFSFLKTL